MKPFDRLRWILALRAPAPVKAVLLCLSLHADKRERSWPSQALIAAEMGISVPTVKRALSEIRKARGQDDQPLLAIARRANRSTVYTLQFDGITMIPRWYHSDPRNSTRNSASTSKQPKLDPYTSRRGRRCKACKTAKAETAYGPYCGPCSLKIVPFEARRDTP